MEEGDAWHGVPEVTLPLELLKIENSQTGMGLVMSTTSTKNLPFCLG